MSTQRRAVIDVGTNSVKLLVADVRAGVVEPVIEAGEQTRLGAGFYETHQLQAGAIAGTAQAVAAFAAQARELQATAIRVIATSAARDAVNPEELTAAIENAGGLKVEIISGEQEADWAFQGVTTDPALAAQPLLLLDVGGGSTEFILGSGGQKHFRRSFALGAVRLLEKLPPGDPPLAGELAACREWVKKFLAGQVSGELNAALKAEVSSRSGRDAVLLVGAGGTAAMFARMEARLDDYDREKIEAVRLDRARVRSWVEKLWSLPLAERKKITGLPPERADVMLPGAVIYEAVMAEFGFDELRVSTRGLRFAAVLESK